jgi:hypothetical protein
VIPFKAAKIDKCSRVRPSAFSLFSNENALKADDLSLD